jgi:hypothetical protein
MSIQSKFNDMHLTSSEEELVIKPKLSVKPGDPCDSTSLDNFHTVSSAGLQASNPASSSKFGNQVVEFQKLSAFQETVSSGKFSF